MRGTQPPDCALFYSCHIQITRVHILINLLAVARYAEVVVALRQLVPQGIADPRDQGVLLFLSLWSFLSSVLSAFLNLFCVPSSFNAPVTSVLKLLLFIEYNKFCS